jgi:phage/plasmid-like protein (TIGR03299 family)
MAHELEMQADGTARMFYAGTAPWHGLGTAVEKELTWEGAIRLAGLDRWNVQLAPLGALTHSGTWEEIEGRQAIMRGMDGQVYGVVTDAYEVIQNEEAGAFLESLVGEGLAMFHTAGSLFGGRRVFVCCKLPDSMEIGPDQVDKYLVALWGHDGTMAFHIKWTPIRVVCWNTASAAFAISGGRVHATDCVSIVHRSNWKDRAAEAREALELTNLYYQRVEECFQRLLQRPFSDSDFTTLAQRLYPDKVKDNGGVIDKSAARAKLTRLFHEGKGMDHPEVRNTRWAAYNAVTEYVDHYWRYQKGKYGGPEDVRMNHVIWGQGAQLKKQVLEMLRVD